MNSQSIIVTLFVFINTFHLLVARSCLVNSDCPFGTCNLESRQCQCNLDCSNFGTSIHQFGCSSRSNTLHDLCTEVNHACIGGRNYRIRQPLLDELNEFEFRCDAIFDIEIYIEHEFCEDQTVCSSNGVCLRNRGTGMSFCRCDDTHEGARCDSLKPNEQRTLLREILSVSPADDKSSTIASSHIAVVVFALVGMFCMIFVGSVVYVHCKRERKEATTDSERNKDKETNSPQDAIITLHFEDITNSANNIISE